MNKCCGSGGSEAVCTSMVPFSPARRSCRIYLQITPSGQGLIILLDKSMRVLSLSCLQIGLKPTQISKMANKIILNLLFLFQKCQCHVSSHEQMWCVPVITVLTSFWSFTPNFMLEDSLNIRDVFNAFFTIWKTEMYARGKIKLYDNICVQPITDKKCRLLPLLYTVLWDLSMDPCNILPLLWVLSDINRFQSDRAMFLQFSPSAVYTQKPLQ